MRSPVTAGVTVRPSDSTLCDDAQRIRPAGGIRSAKQAIEWMLLMKEELGTRWLEPDLFRFGASSLLGDIERQLEHHVTGRYSAAWRHPMA